jgi:hypothetical protein
VETASAVKNNPKTNLPLPLLPTHRFLPVNMPLIPAIRPGHQKLWRGRCASRT